ncbi:hypothetical protein SAMN05421824_0409 [Hyunsoonleella jejuensis]|uniref:Uncharacterized protein n=1 Tax=Hyunsoonleella jejuensis TaxID=419940 RepID=A0A1H9B0A6_9FLAO|nr:hypothetical protein [Hyunsoonleella jejuensis]SEP82225.1 hypothetical protein SAMN05421824_0409 [Hyunsoonleella jejuensis]
MKYRILLIIVVFSCLSCKQNQKTKEESHIESQKDVKEELNPYELSLLDYREINQEFNSSFKVDKFGVRKFNDSIFYFVLRLNDDIIENEVDKYSMGVKAYDHLEKEEFTAFTNLKIRQLHEKKYLIINRVPKGTKYLDSIEFFIYQKNNFKASGKLGEIKVYDILFE